MLLPVIVQDNLSTTTLATTNGGKYRTRHMRVRKNRLKEIFDNKEVRVEHVPTDNMIADVLTKHFVFIHAHKTPCKLGTKTVVR